MDTGSLEYNLVCVKWGDKFSPEHVNRLYRMAKKNISLPFNFYCWTEDSTGLYDEINIVPLDETLDLKAWWWKLTLFKENNLKGINLYLDLDVVIQSNIDHLFDIAKHDKLTLIDRSIEDNFENLAYEKDNDRQRDLHITSSMYNSSIMIWYANENQDLYKKFASNINLYTNLYYGIDRFFTYEINNSRFIGIDESIYYYRGQICNIFKYDNNQISRIKIKNGSIDVFFDPNKNICVFNGCHEDHFYNGMENFLL
jgi:hypothetical protein